MNVAPATVNWQYALLYVDDIIVILKTLKEHLQFTEEKLKLPNNGERMTKKIWSNACSLVKLLTARFILSNLATYISQLNLRMLSKLYVIRQQY